MLYVVWFIYFLDETYKKKRVYSCYPETPLSCKRNSIDTHTSVNAFHFDLLYQIYLRNNRIVPKPSPQQFEKSETPQAFQHLFYNVQDWHLSIFSLGREHAHQTQTNVSIQENCRLRHPGLFQLRRRADQASLPPHCS